MPHFTLPESYCAYCNDNAVQAAVDHILDVAGENLEVPPDLEWCRLPDFNAAVLGAHQVRCDYATALHGLWIKVWQHALDHCGFAARLVPLSFQQHQELLEQDLLSYFPYDTYSLWTRAPWSAFSTQATTRSVSACGSTPKRGWQSGCSTGKETT